MIKSIAPMRGFDSHGSGAWKAARGHRDHNGVDYAIADNSSILSLACGKVTKVGYPYKDDLRFRYIQVTTNGLDLRYFYVEPMVKQGDMVEKGQVLGALQTLQKRYPGITPHLHFEIKDGDEYLEPQKEIDKL